MKPTIEVLEFVLRTKLHRPVERDVPHTGRLNVCAHCWELAPGTPVAVWPCPTMVLVEKVMRGEA